MDWRLVALAGVGLFGVVEAAAQELPKIVEPAPTHQRYSAVGFASWYGSGFHGHATADGEIFDTRSLSAAHRTMPLPSYARVTNLGNGRSVIVRVNDRGPFIRGRILDVSSRVAKLLDFSGVAKVRIDYVGTAAPAGSDERALLASLRTGGAPATSPSATTVARAASDDGETIVAQTAERSTAAKARSPYGDLIMPASWLQATTTTASATP